MKRSHALELGRYCHRFHVVGVSGRLKIAATQQQIDGDAGFFLQNRQRFIYALQFAVRASLHGDLHAAAAESKRSLQKRQIVIAGYDIII